MDIDLLQLENILLKAKLITTNEADRLDIEQFLERVAAIKISGADRPQKTKILASDVVSWVKTGKAIVDIIMLWMHHK